MTEEPEEAPEVTEEPEDESALDGEALEGEILEEAEEVPEEALRFSETREGLFTLSVNPEELIQQSDAWFAEGQFPLALCELRAAAMRFPALEERCRRYAYALDDPAEFCEYLPDRVVWVYAGAAHTPVLDCLRLSAHLRMACSSEVAQAWYQAADLLHGLEGEPFLADYPALRRGVGILAEELRRRRRGFDPQLVRQSCMWGDTSRRLHILSEQARDKCNAKLAETGFYANRIKSLMDALFGVRSELMDCLRVVADNDENGRKKVKEYCAPLVNAQGRPNPNAVKKYIDRAWENQPTIRRQNERLTSSARSNAINRFHTCLDICVQWLECSDNAIAGQEEAERILRQRSTLAACFRDSVGALDALAKKDGTVLRGAVSVLQATLRELADSLEGRMAQRHDYYVDFLRTGEIELDEKYLPVLEQAEYVIPNNEPWTRLRRHQEKMARGEGTDWESVIDRIWNGSRRTPERYNFGTAALIQEYHARRNKTLEALERADIEGDISRIMPRLKEDESLFRAQLELAATYGQIEDNAYKERISNTVVEVLRLHYAKTNNWGFYYRTMDACLAAVAERAKALEPRYRYEFDQLKQQKEYCPMFDKIEELMGQKMFSVAHDYMQLVLREGVTRPPESVMLQNGEEKDYFRQFLQEYPRLIRRCTGDRGQGRTLEYIYGEYAGDDRQDTNHLKRSAREMIKSWPKNNNLTPDGAMKLLRSLSFQVVEVTQGEKYGSLVAKCTAGDTNVFNYPHPIAAFGTRLARTGLEVAVLSGNKTAADLTAFINRLGYTERPTLILLDWALPLAERNAMARALKRESANLATCIVVDRVLMLYLTRFGESERGKVLLQCTLPYHVYNPYTKGDAASPPEMFMGRRAQLEEILTNGKANIIYGGRQLGKTALLRRAAYLVDRREKGNWAIYTDALYRCDRDESLKKLYDELTAADFLPAEPRPDSWEELCARIRRRMDRSDKPVHRFLLLMDEADAFLESSAGVNYQPVACLYQLQSATDGHFKFVLAGLHNVVRFSQATRDNNVMPKLGTLTVKPLTYQEASRLLEEPLYYLGFRITPEQNVLLSQILLSTNYYPGLIHFYCAQLVESLRTVDTDPPYCLDENQIRVLLQKPDFLQQIKEKFFITLDVEEDRLYYRIIAYALAYCYYDRPNQAVEGYTFRDILEMCALFGVKAITDLPQESVKVLLSEMEELNVLVQLNGRYTFNGANFRHMMGDEETVFDELGKFGESEG